MSDVPEELIGYAARDLLLYDPRLSAAEARNLARVALAATVWRVELRAGVGTHVCPELPCTCGYGGYHEPENPLCARNERPRP